MNKDWSDLEITIDQGYGGSYRPFKISCGREGYISFESYPACFHEVHKPVVEDNEKKLSKSEMKDLNTHMQKLLAIENVNRSCVCDGGTFEIIVKFSNGLIRGVHCYHSFEDAELDHARDRIKELLKVNHFLNKYGHHMPFHS